MVMKQEVMEPIAYQSNKTIQLKEIDNENYAWNQNMNTYYRLGEIGSFIWEYCQYPISKQQVISLLMEEYVVSEKECEQQVDLFIRESLANDLLEMVDLRGYLE
ncbi:PqqD family peptide modification chaperone [Bacillus sp. B1-b2]|uniref:PqqD family peptide modification chaperone n=1 Tax=Bacillus sp. B1-b2 TaxID=2653201 RepID=UPI0012624649|nr:PqqD family peptide modification chaperone [Bacillus sp. B1-b2]KAB7671717.1 PqqD family protein [Bacillus sp. B1-b2]